MDAFIASFTTVDKLLEAAPQLMDCVPEAERPFMPLISDETVKRAQYILASFGGGK
jgi:hypothetical protein